MARYVLRLLRSSLFTSSSSSSAPPLALEEEERREGGPAGASMPRQEILWERRSRRSRTQEELLELDLCLKEVPRLKGESWWLEEAGGAGVVGRWEGGWKGAGEGL